MDAVTTVDWVKVAACIAAGICMGIGSIGPSLGQGFIGGKACESIGKKPESAGLITRTMVVALAFAESSAIYALLIALVLLFVVAK
ncbi:ATP synthase F0 subunit C [Candidatus Dependentiae bacterium]|nr:ATP synthase F0 subunit C [Candidatus Dependentiae bacterium]MBU4387691.1 ATP synthase F0 subunit C [Candidatus Dependentiae bacterium]MCG2756605.1 ATP synthase F0 subunit C [Candidatus Dependentiae bacterium]